MPEMGEMVRTNRKRTVYRFRKTFEHLTDGINELLEVKQLRDAICYGSSEENAHLMAVLNDGDDIGVATEIEKRLIAFIFTNPPTIADPNYPNTAAITVRGDNFSFRTKYDTLFSWNYDSNAVRNGDVSVTLNIKLVTPRNVFLQSATEKDADWLRNHGWEAYEVERRKPKEEQHPTQE